MTSDYEKFTFAITAIGPKYYNEIRDIILRFVIINIAKLK